MTLYTILMLIYLITVVGAYKTASNDPDVVAAYSDEALPEGLAITILVICSVLWPVVSIINHIHACFTKWEEK